MDLSPKPLPAGAVDTYREYKLRQKILVTWLQQNGGLRTNQSTRVRNVATEQKLMLSEIEKLTLEVVAKQVQIPDDILYAAQTMLKMRKEISLLYDASTDDGHEWCIDRFEHIVNYLRTLPRLPKSIKGKPSVSTSVQSRSERINRFVSLPTIEMPGLGPDYEAFQKLTVTDQATPKSLKRPHKIVEPSRDDVEQYLTPEMVRTAAFMSPLSLIDTQMPYTLKLCARAGRQQLPLHIAAYVTERVFLGSFAAWLGTMMIKNESLAPETAIDIVDTLFTLYNDGATKFYRKKCSHLNTLTHFVEPFGALNKIWASCTVDEDKKHAIVHVDSSAVRTPYRQILQASNNQTQKTEYYAQLAKDLMIEHRYRLDADQEKLPLGSASRIIELVRHMNPGSPLVFQAFWAHSLYVLHETAQSFEHGFAEETSLLQNRSSSPPNCRLKLLSFLQEVSTDLHEYMPEPVPAVIGCSTYHNLANLEVNINAYLRYRRFDLVTQHPMFAGIEILSILDSMYHLGFQLLAYADVFLGPLHVYNALYQLGVLERDITLFEILCEQFLEAAFYGSRPTKKFSRVWRHLDDLFNVSHSSRREAKINIALQTSKPLRSFANERTLVRTERGQWMCEDSVQGYNKRFKAQDHSFFHKIFNQEDDIGGYIKEETLQLLMGERVQKIDEAHEEANILTKFEYYCRDMDNEHASKLRERGINSSVEELLAALEDTLVREFSGPFPLVSANLLKVWHYCHSMMEKIVAKDQTSVAFYSIPCIREVLAQCDDLRADLAQCGTDESARKIVLGSENMKKKYHLVRRWKRAFAKEFDGLTLADFQWKNL